jgi:tetratricopeptide (TPR) repeat protein
MLDTIRELAAEKLQQGGEEELRGRHAEHFLAVGESLGLTMESLERSGAQRHDVAIAEQHNFRAAIDWAVEADLELAVRIAFALENFWVTHDPREGIRRFDVFVARAGELPVELRAAAHRCRGNVRIMAGDRAGGVEDYEAAIAAYRDAGDGLGILVMDHRALINREVRDLQERRRRLQVLLARYRELGLATGEVQVLGSLAGIERRRGETERAAELVEEAIDRAESIGFTWFERSLRGLLAQLHLEEGRIDEAREQGLRALELALVAGDRQGAAYAVTFFALLAARLGRHEDAGVLWGALEAEAERGPLGMWAAESRGVAEASLPLDDADFARGRERGRRLSFDEALAEARTSID